MATNDSLKRQEYAAKIISALGGTPMEYDPTAKAKANTGLAYVEPVLSVEELPEIPAEVPAEAAREEMYVPSIMSGFTPSTTNDSARVSFAGGLGIETPASAETTTPTSLSQENLPNLDDLNMSPARRRRSKTEEYMMLAKDMFDYVSGVDPNAYLGKTAEMMNKYDKARMEEDPEGYQADMNRAKLLSQKAQLETDPARKAIYGREIKKLLPKETQGLSDELAADYFTASLSEKLQLEQLKGYNKMQQIQAQNKNKLDVQMLKNASSEDIAHMKTETQWNIASLNNEYRKAIADGNNARALTVQSMIIDAQEDLANLNNAADLKQEEMRQSGQTERTLYQQQGAMDRVAAQQAGALARTQLQQKGAMERVMAQQAGAQKRAEIAAAAKGNDSKALNDAIAYRTSPEQISRMKQLNTNAGRWMVNAAYDVDAARATSEAKAYQEFEGLAKQIVQDQLRKIYGAQFTEKEGERFFKSMGLNPSMAPEVRWNLFMNAINDLRQKSGMAPLSGSASAPTKIKSIKKIG